MFVIILKKDGIEKVYSRIFATEEDALRQLNDFRPTDFTGYVASLTHCVDQFEHGVANI